MFFQDSSSLLFHESIEEIERTVPFHSTGDSRSRERVPYQPSVPNRSPAATEDRDCATAAIDCPASHSTRTSTLHPFHAPVLSICTFVHELRPVVAIKVQGLPERAGGSRRASSQHERSPKSGLVPALGSEGVGHQPGLIPSTERKKPAKKSFDGPRSLLCRILSL